MMRNCFPGKPLCEQIQLYIHCGTFVTASAHNILWNHSLAGRLLEYPTLRFKTTYVFSWK